MRTVIGWIAYLSLCALALGIGVAVAVMEKNPLVWAAVVQRGYVPFYRPDPFVGQRELFVLVLGCDENRYYAIPGSNKTGQVLNEFARTDTIQLIRLDFDHKAVGMMQIPRDTMVEVPGYDRMKINGLHPIGGPDATSEAVTQLTGIRPDKVVVLNYDAIKKMIDEVGGVEMYVPKRMKYRDKRGGLNINLKPGRQKLSGETAIGFLRYRHDSDFKRGGRQQEFMVAFKEKVTSPSQKVSVFRLANLAMRVVGGGISADEFASLGKFSSEVPPARIKHGIYPVSEGPGSELQPLTDQVPEKLVECGLRDANDPSTAYSLR